MKPSIVPPTAPGRADATQPTNILDVRDLEIAALNGAMRHATLITAVLLILIATSYFFLRYATDHDASMFPEAVLYAVTACAFATFGFGFLIAAAITYRAFANHVTSAKIREGTPSTPWWSLPPSLDVLRELHEGLCEHARAAIAEREEEINRLRAQYDLLANNIAASVILFDIDGHAMFCSPYTEVLTGYSPEEISVGGEEAIIRFILPEDRERFLRAWEVAELGEDTFVRYRMTHRSGLLLWLETRLVPVCSHDGTVTAVMSVTIDVTDTINYQRQIEEQNRDLRDFASMVSHDLKAPLFTIKGMAAALIEDFGESLPKDAKELVEHILGAGTRLEKLVASILAYSKAASSNAPDEIVSLETTFAHIEHDLKGHVAESKAEISIDAPLPAVRGDGVRLYQIFSNLLVNSLKYAEKSRSPRIHISAEPCERQGFVTIVVKDNGRGIPSDKIDVVFRPFQRVHVDVEGTGVGLACVKKLVERFGGNVSAESVVGSGTSIKVTLPVAIPSPVRLPTASVRTSEPESVGVPG